MEGGGWGVGGGVGLLTAWILSSCSRNIMLTNGLFHILLQMLFPVLGNTSY